MFQLKKLNRDYGQCVEGCSRRIEGRLNEMVRGVVGRKGLGVDEEDGEDGVIEEGSEEFIGRTLEMRTERVIRFAN